MYLENIYGRAGSGTSRMLAHGAGETSTARSFDGSQLPFSQLCDSSQDFKWPSASRGPSAMAELLVNCITLSTQAVDVQKFDR